jgi:RHS repeat-associated protein
MNLVTTATRTRTVLFAIALIFAPALCPRLLALALDDHNPIGMTGVFEGVITSGCAYNVLNHNATRQIDDIVVPGTIGKYGLKMTRYYNSRNTAYLLGLMGPGWSHEYMWGVLTDHDWKVNYPNGNTWDAECFGDLNPPAPLGVSDGWQTISCTTSCVADFRLADGGIVHFDQSNTYLQARTITDPYGQTTTLTYDTSGQLTKVTEPGGRYLQFNYLTVNGYTMLHEVDAYDRVGGTKIDWVVYDYTSVLPGGQYAQPMNCLTSVTYSDGQQASYTYTTDNQPDNPTPPCPCPEKILPLVKTCQDVRYKGPMRQICYDYQDSGQHGEITAERYSLSRSTNGPQVSSINPPVPSPMTLSPNFPTSFTETRGDGPVRTFNYTSLHLTRQLDDSCPFWSQSQDPAPQQFLQSYTDFKGQTTHLYYDGNWYVNSVTDANGHITDYLRGPPPNAYLGPKGIGQILRITHHEDGTHIDYTYQPEPSPPPGGQAIQGHYVQSISDERQNITTYTRDPVTHLVSRIDYPADANTPASYEEFTYNNFGQVLTHHLRNTAWESFVYDGRGLLTDKYNPKYDQQSGAPGGSDPHTHYDYYTAADGKLGWIDRVKKVTLPANWHFNLQATETYEYDRALGADGTTDPNGAAMAGRGLVTKITHTDNTYQSFGYDAYGNKRWEENELRQHTSYICDDYKRVLSVTNPLGKMTSYTYVPTNGGGGSSYKHTTSNPDTITTPTGIVTANVYDQNFRKTSTTAASGTALAATTSFQYDYVGNLTLIIDPRNYQTHNTYDNRNRKQTTTEAYTTSLAEITTWHYDAVSNVYQIDRPDGTQETKSYDALNRVLSDTVPKSTNPVVSLTTWFAYNPSGTISNITDARGSGPGDPNYTTSFYYDASDRKIKMSYPGGSNQQWSYDDPGNLKFRITVNGEEQDFYYDSRNRNNGTWWSNWSNNLVDWRYFGHDAASRLVEAENGTGGWGANVISDVQRSYDAAGHLTQEEQDLYGVYPVYVNYPSYDDDGRLTRMNVSGVSTYDFTYSYDAMGRFEKIFVTNGGQLFQYYYDAASNETERDNVTSNGVNQVYPRDALNRMQYMDVKKGSTVLAHEGYTYDAMNRITLVSYQTGSDSFGYYLDGEVKTANLGNLGHNVTYTLDNKGNRTSVVDNNVTSTYAPNPNDQYTTGAGLSVTNGLEHEIQVFNGVTYGYINDERLISAAATGGPTYSMVYDALGRCMKRSITGGPSTYYVYDGDKPILEYDTNTGASVGVNLYGKGVDEILERVAIGSNSQWSTYYPQQNHEGSVTLLTDTGGYVLERYRYDAFGAPTIYTPTWTTRSSTLYDNCFLFTGREYAVTYRSTNTNTAFSFYEYRARAYNPKLGRFTSEDPKLFDAGDYNLFRYCHNDPIDFTDPMGTEDQNRAGLAPREVSRELADDDPYNYTMAALQRSPRASLDGGTIAVGMLGQALMQQARREAQTISEGQENRSTAPQGLYRPHATPLAPGLAPVDQYQIAYGKAGADRMGQLSEGSMEANVAGAYNADTKKFGYSGYVRSHPTVGGGQEALTPKLPPGNWGYAFQAHGHHAMKGFSPGDYLWANTRALPIFIHRADGVLMYVPPAQRIDSLSRLGQVFAVPNF